MRYRVADKGFGFRCSMPWLIVYFAMTLDVIAGSDDRS